MWLKELLSDCIRFGGNGSRKIQFNILSISECTGGVEETKGREVNGRQIWLWTVSRFHIPHSTSISCSHPISITRATLSVPLAFFFFCRLSQTTMVICLPRITVCHAQGGWWTDWKTRSKTWITWLNFTAKKNITVAEKRKKGRHQSQCRAPSRGLGNLDGQWDRMGWDKGLRRAGLGPEGNSVARLYKMACLFSRNISTIQLLLHPDALVEL